MSDSNPTNFIEQQLQKVPKDRFPFEVTDKIIKKAMDKYKSIVEATEWQELDITIYGEPKAWKRERARTMALPGGAGRKFCGMYDPNYSFKKIIADYVRDAMEEKKIGMIHGPVHLRVDFYKPMPKSIPPYKGLLYELKLIQPTSKPDVDNYIKQVQDALNKIAYDDDAQIVDEGSDKWLSYTPRMEIHMSFLRSDIWK